MTQCEPCRWWTGAEWHPFGVSGQGSPPVPTHFCALPAQPLRALDLATLTLDAAGEGCETHSAQKCTQDQNRSCTLEKSLHIIDIWCMNRFHRREDGCVILRIGLPRATWMSLVVERLPLIWGVVLGSRDQVPHRVPHGEPASPSTCVSASLCVCVCVSNE